MKALRLAQRIKQAPTTPGVYRWYGRRGKLLYIGKAANLRSRLSSYPKTTNDRIRLMIEQAVKLDWETTPTDIEALILESQLIKTSRPPFNIVMRDDKNYFYVAIPDEQFPRPYLTHQLQPKKLPADFIGPFTEGTPIKATLRVLRSLFPYCSCKQKHHLRCLNAHIGKCPGYCCLKTPATAAQKTAYRRNIRAIRDILTGKRDKLILRMHREGYDIGPVVRVFQNAQINARRELLTAHAQGIEALRKELEIPGALHRIEGYDVANIQQGIASGAMVVFTNGRPDKAEYRLFNIRNAVMGDVPQLTQMLTRRFSHKDWPRPDLIVIDGAKGQLNAATKIVSNTPIIAVVKNDRHQPERILTSLQPTSHQLSSLPRAARDLLVHIDSEAHRFSINQYRRRHRKVVA